MPLRLVQVAAVVIAGLMAYVGYEYSRLMLVGQIKPVFTSWLMFWLASSLSFWTYWSTEKHSLLGNIVNLVDSLVTWVVLATILYMGQANLNFTRLEQGCLVATAIITIFWRYTKQHFWANLAIQTILVIGYIPLLHHLWFAKVNTEPTYVWMSVWCAAVLAFIPAKYKGETIALIYAGRGLFLVTIALFLMARIEWRS